MRQSAAEMAIRDQQTLAFIARFQKRRGVSPTYEQIAEGLGLAGKSSVQRRIQRLINGGRIVIERPGGPILIVKGKK